MKIYTVTLNPAFDKHLYIDNFAAGKEYIADDFSICAGGKGINVSKILSFLGTDNVAVGILGKNNSNEFETLLGPKFNSDFIYADGNIRENITVHTRGSEDTRLCINGFCVCPELAELCFSKISADDDTFVVFSGSLPEKTDVSFVSEKLNHLKANGAKIVLDSRSFDNESLKKAYPFLIKPNRYEAQNLVNFEITTKKDAYNAAVKLVFEKTCENAIITLDKYGGVYFGTYGSFFVHVPEIVAVSTVGAGDSTVAGFVSEFSKSGDIVSSLKTAFALGSACCTTKNFDMPSFDEVEKIKKDIVVEKLY